MKNHSTIKFIIFFLIFSLFCGFNEIVYGEINEQGNTSSNILNLGYINKDGEWIYYSNIADGSKLYKSKLNGDNETQICDDIPNYINVAGKWIYYSNVKDGFKIYKVKKDGTERTKLNNESSFWINVIDNWIYYGMREKDGQKLYKIKTDGSGQKEISKNKIYGLIIRENWIYYSNESDNHKIYKVKLDESEELKINDEESFLIDIIGNDIYYQNYTKGKKIYKIGINGENNTKINNDNSQFANISNKWIYYANANEDYRLYKIKIDGSNKTRLNNESSGEINVIGEYIYYWGGIDNGENSIKLDPGKLYRIKNNGRSKEVVKIEKVNTDNKEEKLSISSSIIILLVLGLGTFLEVWKLVSTCNINKFVNNLQGEMTNEDAKRYISLIKKSRIVKRSDIYIVLRRGVELINSSYKIDDELKEELKNTLGKRGISLYSIKITKDAR
ncbi:DUF5050 domain-containing protein [Clostridium sp. ZS2-4]|uniref:DUF5050 domain-containing protein n=1 Tax=Clostridium sp. ZS2-4 TaxID=2987703 RepID=UPI00227AA214|nr:DUF5050 domain-containing protein [Clostridium sp. ZS2-4]MCY6356788.1 DUF5050 domain-containing protein [Clostridium sp. ZS2-4]